MGKRIGFTVSKVGESWGAKGVFKSVAGSGHVVRVMNAHSYAKAAKRADRSLAASVLSSRQGGKK